MMGIRTLLVGMGRIPRVAGIDTRKYRVIGGINVAIRAGRAIMRDAEVAMVEDRPQPGGGHPGGVAGNASGRIVGRNVIGHVRAVILRICEIGLVAAVAIRSGLACRVVDTDMAVGTRIDHGPDGAGDGGARRQHVWTLQREAGVRVIEGRIGPHDGVVAMRAE